MSDEDEPVAGRIAADVAAELPGLRLWWLEVDAGAARGGPELRERLRAMSDRFRGAEALRLRERPVPHAYRAFHRQIGLDPDVDRVAVEAVAVERLRAGGFVSRSALEDACTIAVMETAVGVWALDAATLEGPLEIRLSPQGRLVVADGAGPVALLCGDVLAAHAPGPATRRAVVFAVGVPGVPAIAVSEALWTVADILGG